MSKTPGNIRCALAPLDQGSAFRSQLKFILYSFIKDKRAMVFTGIVTIRITR